MSDDKNSKIFERVQFGKEATAAEIADAIAGLQDEWAKRNPEKAHRLYPKVYDEKGERIKKD